MHAGGPDDDHSDTARGNAPPPLPAQPTQGGEHRFPHVVGGAVPKPSEPPASRYGVDPSRVVPDQRYASRDGMRKFWIGVLIVLVGIPVGLFIFGALLFGACLLGR